MSVIQTAYSYACRWLRVIDADTLLVDVDLGLRSRRTEALRLLGVNAPERGTPEGKAASAYVMDWLAKNAPGELLTAYTAKPDSREKYGRWLARLVGSTGACLNDDLLASGHAVPMKG